MKLTCLRLFLFLALLSNPPCRSVGHYVTSSVLQSICPSVCQSKKFSYFPPLDFFLLFCTKLACNKLFHVKKPDFREKNLVHPLSTKTRIFEHFFGFCLKYVHLIPAFFVVEWFYCIFFATTLKISMKVSQKCDKIHRKQKYQRTIMLSHSRDIEAHIEVKVAQI